MVLPIGQLLCDDNDVPIWCTSNPSAIWCPQDPGFEYGGGSSSGGGAGRTWNAELCFDVNGALKDCNNYKTPNNVLTGTIPFMPGTTQLVTSTYFKSGQPMDFQARPFADYITCLDKNKKPINCALVTSQWDESRNSNGGWFVVSDGCLSQRNQVLVPCMFANTAPSAPSDIVKLTDSLQLFDLSSHLPYHSDDFTNGYPNSIYTYEPPAPPPDPSQPPQMPETELECANIICQCMQVLANIMHSVDMTTQDLLSATLSIESELPDFISKLDEIITLIDDIAFEVVNEAGTNFWDVLGGAFSDIFDLVEFLIEKIIYLVIPEDTTAIRSAFDLLSADIQAKVAPVHTLQDKFTEVIPEQKEDVLTFSLNLPVYGEIPFFNTLFLNEYRSILHAFSGGIMILFTAIWAYRKISSEMVR